MKSVFYMSLLLYLTGWRASSVLALMDQYAFGHDEAFTIDRILRKLEVLENETKSNQKC